MSTNLPKKISPCPIIDALIEIRFSVNIHQSAIFGIIYNEIKSEYPKVESLPILQLPEPLREADPALRFKPHYKVSNDNFVIQIGPEVISISSSPEYKGWMAFSEKIYNCLIQVDKLGIIDKVHRLGMRYINFFELDIFDKINLSFLLDNKKMNPFRTHFKTEIVDSKFTNTLQVSNIAKFKNKDGSIIDIDTYLENGLDNFFKEKDKFIESGHISEKKLFFSLLKNDFLKTLNPKT